jgi:hypothetical protein
MTAQKKRQGRTRKVEKKRRRLASFQSLTFVTGGERYALSADGIANVTLSKLFWQLLQLFNDQAIASVPARSRNRRTGFRSLQSTWAQQRILDRVIDGGPHLFALEAGRVFTGRRWSKSN